MTTIKARFGFVCHFKLCSLVIKLDQMAADVLEMGLVLGQVLDQAVEAWVRCSGEVVRAALSQLDAKEAMLLSPVFLLNK